MHISEIVSSCGLSPNAVSLYGTDKAKVALTALQKAPQRGRLILVSAITPTPAGEGKTTISIGLAQGLKKIGKSVALALRQPSMGPVFGRKGGATGGGKSVVQPSAAINLHFTGDFHAITSANNLLSAVLDNALHYGTTGLSASRVTWKRVLDVNDRALRRILTDQGGRGERSTGFDITAASEIMAILCLAESREDLRRRIDRILLGFTNDGRPVFAEELGVTGALLALLNEAIEPNLVQSEEGVPAFVHGGPFANIAHGCNSVLATRMALGHADFAVTEAGFAFDLGGEKFMHIKCRQSGLAPDAIVVVATVRALKMHGGTDLASLRDADSAAVQRGLDNLAAHLDSAAQFGRPRIVAINKFADDSAEEIQVIEEFCRSRGVACAVADAFAQGGDGCRDLAHVVAATVAGEAPSPLPMLYNPADGTMGAIKTIAQKIYGADGADFTDTAWEKLATLEQAGLTGLPVCMAKTQNSLSDNASFMSRPKGFRITVRDFEVANGAGFLVALTGTLARMPALPKSPAALRINVQADGTITGI